MADDAPVRVALRGRNMKECISGAAFADVVINTFFGHSPSVDGKRLLEDERAGTPVVGELKNVRNGKSLVRIVSTRQGLKCLAPDGGK